MLTSVLIIVLKILIVDSAPKLGHVLFDPLIYEAVKLGPKDVPDVKDIPELKDPISSDDDFLENDRVIETVPRTTTVLTQQTSTPKRILYETIQKIRPKQTINIVITAKTTAKRKYRSGDVRYLRKKKDNNGTIAAFGYDFDDTICKVINAQNRVLCGYDKNQGNIPEEHLIEQLPNGCVIRGDRIECGYVQGGNTGNKRLRSEPKDRPEVERLMLSYNKLTVQSPNTTSTIFNITTELPKVSTQVLSDKTQKDTIPVSGSTHTTKPTTNTEFTKHSTLKIVLSEASSTKNDLNSGNLTIVLLTSRANIPKLENLRIDAATTGFDIFTNTAKDTITLKQIEAVEPAATTLQVIDESSPKDKLPEIEDKPYLREEIVENIEDNPKPSGCTSCVLKSFLNKRGLRNPDSPEPTETAPKKCVTRCVEIGDRIVCYPLKVRTTAAP